MTSSVFRRACPSDAEQGRRRPCSNADATLNSLRWWCNGPACAVSRGGVGSAHRRQTLPEELSFRILGPLEVWRDATLVELRAAKQRTLLALLLLNRSGTGRDALIDALWGERSPAGARNTLQVYVSSLRRTLGRGAIETTPAGYRLHLEQDALDAERFERLLRSGQEAFAADNPATAAETLGEALGLWRGPALADFRYDGFAQAEAGRLDELRLVCREERIDAELALGRHATLVGELEALVLEHPLRERMRSQLILALYRSGRHPEALAQYQATRRMLADELGLEPSPELRELERMILSHDPALAPPEPAGKPSSNLPLQPTPFIGREREVDELVELVESGTRRLVTLTGAGGSGKTRLAVEVAARLLPAFLDGVWWVPLQSLADPDLVLPTIASAVGTQEAVTEWVGSRRMLLVLDNFEQLLAAGGEVAAMLRECGNLRLFVTSREPLRVAAEREYRVAPMTEADAVALFDERAGAGGSGETRIELCRRLDCLPLAVELAAARTGTLTLEQILRHLDDQLSFLTGGPRDVPARQQTLRATIDWSYDLLTSAEQRLFQRLGVFAGSWDLAGAAAVCEVDVGSALLDGIRSLTEKSLVNRGQDTAEARYAMLETIRGFATEKLREEGALRAVQRRHAEHLLAFVERGLLTGEELSVHEVDHESVREELPNLRGALAFSIAEGDLELSLRLAGAGGWAFGTSGGLVEARAWMIRVLDIAEHLETRERARTLLQLGECEEGLGNLRAAAQRYEQALDLFERHGDRRGVLHALIFLIELTGQTQDPTHEGLLPEALALVNEVGNGFDRARLLLAGAWIETRRGGLEDADAMIEEGLELMRSLGVPRRVWAWYLVSAGYMAIERQDFARARSTLQEFLAGTSASHPVGAASAHCNLGLVELYEHQRDAASEHLRQALVLGGETEAKMLIAECLYGMAAVAAMDHEAERAARLWGAAETLKEATSAPLSAPERFIVDEYLEPVRAELDDDAYEAARRGGAALELSEAIAYALAQSSRPEERRSGPTEPPRREP